MQERHRNRKQYFDEQALTTSKFVIPFIESVMETCKPNQSLGGVSVLEVGCGEGGNLKPFLDKGYHCMGVDINEISIHNAENFFADHPYKSNIRFVCQDFYTFPTQQKFDIIILRDVIEHIPNQERFIPHLKKFLSPDGLLFFGFPPWMMPFGGHQQIGVSFLSKVPFIHLLPVSLYSLLLRSFGEDERKIQELLDIKKTGITIERFERCLRNSGLSVVRKTLWFIQPNYETKFGLKPRKVYPLLTYIPFLRDFYTTAGYYIVRSKEY